MAEPRTVWPLIVGVIAVLGGVAGAVALWFGAETRFDDNVASFARAPAGCDTTLEFASPGEFVLFVETRGRLADLAGDCDAEATYHRESSNVPRPDLTLVDQRGDELVLRSTGGADYDRNGYRGSAYRLVSIERPGTHVLTVVATDGDGFVVAVGREPQRGVVMLRWSALASLVGGVLVGAVVAAVATRRTGSPPAPTVGVPWPDVPGWPTGPPIAPAPIPSPPARPPGEPSAGPWGPPRV